MWPVIAIGAGLVWLFSGCERDKSPKKDNHADVKSGEKDTYEPPKENPWNKFEHYHSGAKW